MSGLALYPLCMYVSNGWGVQRRFRWRSADALLESLVCWWSSWPNKFVGCVLCESLFRCCSFQQFGASRPQCYGWTKRGAAASCGGWRRHSGLQASGTQESVRNPKPGSRRRESAKIQRGFAWSDNWLRHRRVFATILVFDLFTVTTFSTISVKSRPERKFCLGCCFCSLSVKTSWGPPLAHVNLLRKRCKGSSFMFKSMLCRCE